MSRFAFVPLFAAVLNAVAQPGPSVFAKLPVREVTVFKDGHAFVAHQGVLPTDAKGHVLMDYLPAPVIGTFWPYAAGKEARLTGVVAGRRLVKTERTALAIRELLEANTGATVEISDDRTNRYTATVMGFPARSIEEQERTSPDAAGEKLPLKSNVILLRTSEGVKAVPVEQIRDVTFKEFKGMTMHEEYRNVLTLNLDWNGKQPARQAEVGLMYLQKGIRWIPSYKLTLDGKGNAVVRLQATIINELTDLYETDVNLVIGVPTFAFKETLDPLALQQAAAQLSQYFQTDQRPDARGGLLAANFSNAIMTQMARSSEYRQAASEPGAAPEDVEGSRTEDLFVFNIKRLTLRKGERTAVPVVEYTIPYEDVFVLDLPFTPPPEVRANNAQQQELLRLFNAPKVMHKVRLQNKSGYPLTTAPALIMRGESVVAQGMMTYTAAGATSDLALTTAVDVQVERSEKEVKQTPNALQQDKTFYARIDMEGKVTLINHRKTAARVEVNRYVLGTADRASAGGKLTRLNVFDDAEAGVNWPHWWHWYGWPSWWHQFNGTAKIAWNLEIAAGKAAELEYEWHYFWR
jgi:hypothetical protein